MSQSLTFLPADVLRTANQVLESAHRAMGLAENAFGELASSTQRKVGADRVSIGAQQAFAKSVGESKPPIDNSLRQLPLAAAALARIARDFVFADEAGGASVQPAGGFGGGLAGGLAPLAQLATTVPQQIAQAASGAEAAPPAAPVSAAEPGLSAAEEGSEDSEGDAEASGEPSTDHGGDGVDGDEGSAPDAVFV